MPETLFLGTINNAGMSFTENTNLNIVKMYNYAESSSQHVDNYAHLQDLFYNNCGVTQSNVRMYSPFFLAQGLINPYSDREYDITNYFTSTGKAYAKALNIAYKIDDSDRDIKEKAYSIAKKILAIGMYERKRQNALDYYFDFLSLCVRYSKVNLSEFNYMVYYKEKHPGSDYIEEIKDNINAIRNDEKVYIYKQNRTSKSGNDVIEDFPSNTFNYTLNLLVQCGLIVEKDKYYYISDDMMNTVKDLLEV